MHIQLYIMPNVYYRNEVNPRTLGDPMTYKKSWIAKCEMI